MPFFNLTSISQAVQKTLTDRGTYKNLNHVAGKATWVRMASNAIIKNGEEVNDEARKKYIFTSGIISNNPINGIPVRTTFDEIYNVDSTAPAGLDNFSYRSIPGIENFTVSNKGEFGALRTADVHFIVPNYQDFNVIEKLYMTAGITVSLEWGWSHEFDITHLLDLDFTQILDEQKKMFQNMINSGGTYDGLIGKVSKFNWTLNENGFFDCNISIVSTGEFLLGMPLSINSMNAKHKFKIESGKGEAADKEEPRTNVEYLILDTKDTLSSKKTIKVTASNDSELFKMAPHQFDNETIIAAVKIDGFKSRESGKTAMDAFISSLSFSRFGGASDSGYFVTWGYIEDQLINAGVLTRAIDGGILPAGEPTFIFRSVINESSILISSTPYLQSSDPRICVLPTTFSKTKYPKFTSITHWSADGGHSGRLRYILVNLDLVFSAYSSSNTINDFVLFMLNRISAACGNIWNFKIAAAEKNPAQLIVYDANFTPISPKEEAIPYVFNAFNESSIVRSLEFDVTLPSELGAIAIYGTNKHEDEQELGAEPSAMFRLIAGQAVDRLSYPQGPPTLQKTADLVGDKNTNTDTKKPTFSEVRKEYDKMMNDAYNKATDDTTSAALKVLTTLLAWPKNNKTSDSTNVGTGRAKLPIAHPYKLKLTVDGISGIRNGSVFTLSDNVLPQRYLQAGIGVQFITIGVEHTVAQSDWTTTIEGVANITVKDSNNIGNYKLTANTADAIHGNITKSQETALVPEFKAGPSKGQIDPNTPASATVTDQFIQALKRWEGVTYKSYPDANGRSIGVGHFIQPHEAHLNTAIIDDSQVHVLLKSDLIKSESAVKKTIKVPMKQQEYEAMVALTFNIGTEAFRTSTVAARFNLKESYERIEQAFLMWRKSFNTATQRKEDNPDLVARRQKELYLFKYGTYI